MGYVESQLMQVYMVRAQLEQITFQRRHNVVKLRDLLRLTAISLYQSIDGDENHSVSVLAASNLPCYFH